MAGDGIEHDLEYVEARRVLLDALQAIGPHRRAVVLVGAQAIYQRLGAGNFLVAPFTSDGDLALDPSLLDDEPLLEEALVAAGFVLAINPGTWSRDDVQIDFMVPKAVSGSGRRGARLGRHGAEVARKAQGLEAAIIDFDLVSIASLDPTDSRTIQVAVAGLAALLVAKLHKIAEREETPARWSPKDGLDVLRILQGADLDSLAGTLSSLERNPTAGSVTRAAHSHLRRLFGTPKSHGSVMAVRATIGVEEPATIAAACAALANELLLAWDAESAG